MDLREILCEGVEWMHLAHPEGITCPPTGKMISVVLSFIVLHVLIFHHLQNQ
jgi:hypothetical protein